MGRLKNVLTSVDHRGQIKFWHLFCLHNHSVLVSKAYLYPKSLAIDYDQYFNRVPVSSNYFCLIQIGKKNIGIF